MNILLICIIIIIIIWWLYGVLGRGGLGSWVKEEEDGKPLGHGLKLVLHDEN